MLSEVTQACCFLPGLLSKVFACFQTSSVCRKPPASAGCHVFKSPLACGITYSRDTGHRVTCRGGVRREASIQFCSRSGSAVEAKAAPDRRCRQIKFPSSLLTDRSLKQETQETHCLCHMSGLKDKQLLTPVQMMLLLSHENVKLRLSSAICFSENCNMVRWGCHASFGQTIVAQS